MNNFIKIVILVVILCFSGCLNIFHGKFSFDYDKFSTEKQKWIEASVKDYSFTYVSGGFRYEKVHVEIENGEYKKSIPDTHSDLQEYKDTITDIYNDIEMRYKEEKRKVYFDVEVYCKGIDIVYDEKNHIPTSVVYRYHIPPGVHVDGNNKFTIEDYKNKKSE